MEPMTNLLIKDIAGAFLPLVAIDEHRHGPCRTPFYLRLSDDGAERQGGPDRQIERADRITGGRGRNPVCRHPIDLVPITAQ